MIKTFLILLILQNLLISQQIILVVSENFTSAKATLTCYENGKKVFDTIDVNIGKNGLGWGIGEQKLTQKPYEPIKKEGDKKAPAGIFRLTSVFGYEKDSGLKIGYIYADKNLICVDESGSKFYNRIVTMPNKQPKSFEKMRRDDNLYYLGVVVEHNKIQKPNAGSCIFLHIQRDKNTPTLGCTSMSLENIKKITKWLDKSKNPILIQIPKSSLKEVKKLYPQLPL